MILPDSIHPKYSLYYNGAVVLDVLLRCGTVSIADLFVKVRQSHGISFGLLLLTLDWLYLINAVNTDEKGVVQLCS